MPRGGVRPRNGPRSRPARPDAALRRLAARLRVPGFGYANILPKYAAATGGDAFAAFDRQSIEQAYSRITAVARNQYTLGYNAKATPSTTYRSIDVRVHRPGLTVVAKDGYYPLPPPSAQPTATPAPR